MSLFRELKHEPPDSSKPQKGKRRRGRQVDTDPRADKQVFDAWQSGHHRNYADLARNLRMRRYEVAKAIDRHRHRVTRDAARRRTNPPDS